MTTITQEIFKLIIWLGCNMFHRPLLSAIALLTIISSSAMAQIEPLRPKYIQALEQSGAQITYLGNDLGLDGWLTEKGVQRQFVYVTPNKEAFIVGVLLDRDGQNITAEQIDRYMKKNPAYLEEQLKKMQQQSNAVRSAPAPKAEKAPVIQAQAPAPATVKPIPVDPSSPSEKLFAQIEAGNWVEIGQKDAPIVYAFIDPECPHCHQFITDLREANAYDQGNIRTRLVPVGIMGEESLYEAATLINTQNPQKAFFDHLDGDEFALPIDKKVNTQKVQKNMAIMQDWKLDVTPFIVYRNKAGSVKIVRGGPKNLTEFLNDLK